LKVLVVVVVSRLRFDWDWRIDDRRIDDRRSAELFLANQLILIGIDTNDR
jgi:hypothetical protein